MGMLNNSRRFFFCVCNFFVLQHTRNGQNKFAGCDAYTTMTYTASVWNNDVPQKGCGMYISQEECL